MTYIVVKNVNYDLKRDPTVHTEYYADMQCGSMYCVILSLTTSHCSAFLAEKLEMRKLAIDRKT